MTDPGRAGRNGDVAPEGLSLRFDATTPAEFAELMRTALQRSGLTPGQLAAKTMMPRSTVYNWAREDNRRLPRSRDQVRLFLRACHLDDAEIHQALKSWSRLYSEMNGHAGDEARAAHAVASAETAAVAPPTTRSEPSPVGTTAGLRLHPPVDLLPHLSTGEAPRSRRHRFELLIAAVVALMAVTTALFTSITAWRTSHEANTYVERDAPGNDPFLPSADWYNLAEYAPVFPGEGTVRTTTTVSGVTYLRTLSSSAPSSSLTYALNRSCDTLTVSAGVADHTRSADSRVRFTIRLDDEDAAYLERSPGDPQFAVGFSVRGALRMTLKIDNPTRAEAAWLELRTRCVHPPGQKLG